MNEWQNIFQIMNKHISFSLIESMLPLSSFYPLMFILRTLFVGDSSNGQHLQCICLIVDNLCEQKSSLQLKAIFAFLNKHFGCVLSIYCECSVEIGKRILHMLLNEKKRLIKHDTRIPNTHRKHLKRASLN